MKKFIFKQRGMSLMECTKEFIEKGYIPMIASESLQKSKIYKEVDKFLLEQGYKKVFVEEEIKGMFITPTHYEYIK